MLLYLVCFLGTNLFLKFMGLQRPKNTDLRYQQQQIVVMAFHSWHSIQSNQTNSKECRCMYQIKIYGCAIEDRCSKQNYVTI